MNPLSFLRQLYSLDTLDTRLTTPSKTPLDVVQKEQQRTDVTGTNIKQENLTARGAQPSKWNTPEFYLYGIVFVVVVPLMFKAVMDVSNRGLNVYILNEEPSD